MYTYVSMYVCMYVCVCVCVCIYITSRSAPPPSKEQFWVCTRSQTQWPLQHLKRNFCGSQTINVSAQTTVRDPCCLVRQTPHLHYPHSLNTLQVSNLSALRLSKTGKKRFLADETLITFLDKHHSFYETWCC